MDVEQAEDNNVVGYSKVNADDEEQDNNNNIPFNLVVEAEHDDDLDEQEPLSGGNGRSNHQYRNHNINDGVLTTTNTNTTDPWYYKTLLPDNAITIFGYPVVDGSAAVKLLKFILLTFLSITVMHVMVAKFSHDRDRNLKLSYLWVFESNLIVLDSTVFFVVGRLWKQRGVDHIFWILPMMICNIYFESQQFIFWLQNSVTLYAMHCIWPWQLWVFVLVLIPTIGTVVILHIKRAYETNLLLVKIVEILLCLFFFVVPLVPSSYFHFHHWFAGFLLGMHCNFDVWWSRAAMAYCWGMYINGIAVYGRDPVLTCEYAYFLSVDMHCPYTKCYLEALQDMKDHPNNATKVVEEMVPVDWRNCSATGYHP